jgi:iron complex transport system permease protein
MAVAHSSSSSSVPAPVATRDGRWHLAARGLGLLVGLAAILLIALLSIRVGSIGVSTRDTWNALFHYDATNYEQVVIRSLRVPRTVIALGVGGALAAAGAVMQAVTRNPLAGPSILGVSSGASFAIVTAIYFLGLTSAAQYVWFAFFGALIAAVLVFLVGSAGGGGATPVKLALAGVVVSALLGAWTNALILLDEETLDQARFWFAGSVTGRDLGTFWTVSPFLLGGMMVTLFIGHQMNVLSMGDDTARALGMNITRTRIIASILVVTMTGAAVATAGPIGFVGLATPHLVRAVIGPDYRWVLPYSIITGAVLLTAADILGRVIMRPGEIQVGIVTAFLGAPFLIYLARKKVMQ